MAGDNLIGARPSDFKALSDQCQAIQGEVQRETNSIVDGVNSLKEFLGQAAAQFMKNWTDYQQDLLRFPQEIKNSDVEFYNFYDLYKTTDDLTLQEWLDVFQQRQSPSVGSTGPTTGTTTPSATPPGGTKTLEDMIRERKQGDAY